MGGQISGTKKSSRWQSTLDAARKRSNRIVSNPYFAAGITCLIIFTGGMFGLYANEIRQAWPFTIHSYIHVPPVVLSWIVFLLSAIFFFLRQRVDDKRRDEAQQKLEKRSEQLEELIRTVPPRKFLDSFEKMYRDVDGAATGALGAPEPPFELDVIENSIRGALGSIASLAKIFDDREGERYAANVMLFRKSASMSAAQEAEIAARLRFCEHGVSVKNLLGVLDLEPALSATTVDGLNPDPFLSKFALPVPLVPKFRDLYKLLPGAPLAFVENRTDVHEDFARLRAWCDEKCDLSQSVKLELNQYLENQAEHMRSFISIPLSPQWDMAPFAVLNVHSRQVGMLRDHPEAVGQFVMLVKPLQSILVKLLKARESCPGIVHV